jgi:hypothetical protein
MRRLSSLAVALLATLCLAPPAQADYDPLGSGQTKLSLDASFLALLKQNGVKLSTVAPAKLQGGTVSFPVSGGKFDPTSARGAVEHEGALVFRAGGKSIPLKALQLKTTQRRSPLSAKVGGSQLKLAQAKSLTVTRSGFGDKVKTSSLTLSSKLATRLGKKLGLKGAFKEGLPLGQALTVASPETATVLAKGKAELTLAPAFAAKLASLFVAVNPVFPAERPGAGQFTLPLFGGTIAPDGSQGTIETSGSLELLQLGGGQVFWAEGWLDLATRALSAEAEVRPSPPYAGKLGRLGIAALLGPGALAADPRARTVSLSGAPLALDAATAATFNEVFAKPQGRDGVFAAGEALGAVSFIAEGQ